MVKITFVAIKFIFYINYFEFNTIKVKYLIYFSFHSLISYSYEFYWCSVFPLRDKAFLAATAHFKVIKEITTNTIHPTVAVMVFNYLQFCSFILKYLAYFSFHNFIILLYVRWEGFEPPNTFAPSPSTTSIIHSRLHYSIILILRCLVFSQPLLCSAMFTHRHGHHLNSALLQIELSARIYH